MAANQLSLFQIGRGGARRARPRDEELQGLIARVYPDFKPVWEGLDEEAQLTLAAYFLLWSSKNPRIGPTRPRVLAWYCPFAAQAAFPSGHRYCPNVYSGCAHECLYTP